MEYPIYCVVFFVFACLRLVVCVPNVASVSYIVHSRLPIRYSLTFIFKNNTPLLGTINFNKTCISYI